MSIKQSFPMFLLLANVAFGQSTDLAFQPTASPASVTIAGNEASRATFQRFVDEVLNKKLIAAVPRYFAPLFRHHALPEELQPVPVEAYQAWQKSFNAAFPDAQWTVDFVEASNDVISYHLTVTATHQGVYAGIPATGRTVTASETGIMRLKNGLIVECWATFDDEAVMKTLKQQ